ncbi:sensor domain-containing diguanylate cyclase [Niveibacterium umoris]|uniref:diguanylate cyclase n=1 Tax=Niveibacterium umoris TaxID=1193620 RepID=A0A840BRM3_9RHOO|nr:GGDEF domain-containing protein [Niveibacterium umoris]MBB4013047.1 diguanylate cyclase (GGDEF)-like protein [Niveibacterium umoris]
MAVMAAAIHAALALVLVLTVRRRSELPGGDLLSLGMALVALGVLALVANMIYALPGGRAIFNAGVLSGFVAFLEGLRRFDGAPARVALIPAAATLALVVSIGLSGTPMLDALRVTLVSLLLVSVNGAIAVRVLEPGAPEEQPARVVVLLAATGLGGVFCARIAATWLPGGLLAHDELNRVLCYVGVSVLSLMLTFGWLLWANLRVAAQLGRLARIDDLTGLANRLSLTEALVRQHARSQRSGRLYGVVMLNIDRFGAIDEGFGASAGDRVLVEISKRLLVVARADDMCARFSGDEFCVLLPETNLVDAQRFAERVRRAITGEPVRLGDGAIAVSVSIGVADSLQGERPHAVVRRADLALAAAREAGGNRIEGWQAPTPVDPQGASDESGPLTSFLRNPLRA